MIFLKNEYSARGVLLAIGKAFGYFAIWFAVQLCVGFFAGIVLSVTKGSLAEEYINAITPHVSIICNCITVLVLALYAFLRGSSLTERASIYKMPPRFVISMMLMGITFSYAIAVALGLINAAKLFPEEWVTKLNEANGGLVSSTPVINFICVVVMAPVLEEILFRGFILGTLKKEMHPWVAILISALVFGVAHGTPIGIIYASALGVVMGWLCVKFESVVPSLIFHMAYNAAASYSENITILSALIAVFVLIFEFYDINR